MIFLHSLKYSIKSLFKDKVILFWTLIFPLLMATLFYMILGNINESTEVFHKIPVAVVEINGGNEAFSEVIDSMDDGEDALFVVTKTDDGSAKEQLEKGELTGIFYANSDTVTLTVNENGNKETVCSVFLEQYLQTADTIEKIAAKSPEKLAAAIETLSADVDYTIEKKSTNGDMNDILQFFYALFGMTALYGMFMGLDRVEKLQANLSPLGARRGVTPVPKIVSVLSEFCSCWLAEFLIQLILFLYVDVILGMNMGVKIPAILLLCLISSATGTSLGIFIGSIPKLSLGSKYGIGISFTMFLSFCSGLMFSKMQIIIQENCPLFAKLNPASLIVDSFYALNVYDTYTRFFQNLLYLSGVTLVLCLLSALMTRRNKYASL